MVESALRAIDVLHAIVVMIADVVESVPPPVTVLLSTH